MEHGTAKQEFKTLTIEKHTQTKYAHTKKMCTKHFNRIRANKPLLANNFALQRDSVFASHKHTCMKALCGRRKSQGCTNAHTTPHSGSFHISRIFHQFSRKCMQLVRYQCIIYRSGMGIMKNGEDANTHTHTCVCNFTNT